MKIYLTKYNMIFGPFSQSQWGKIQIGDSVVCDRPINECYSFINGLKFSNKKIEIVEKKGKDEIDYAFNDYPDSL